LRFFQGDREREGEVEIGEKRRMGGGGERKGTSFNGVREDRVGEC